MAEAKKPEAPRPAALAAKSVAAVPVKSAAVPAKTVAVAAKTTAVPARTGTVPGAIPARTTAVPARAGAVPVKTAAPAARLAGVPAKTAVSSAAVPGKTATVPVRTAAVPANTATALVKPGLAGKAGTAAATDVSSKDLAKPNAAKATTAESKGPGDKDKLAAADTANGDADPQNFEEMRNKFKPAKKSVAIPTELLSNAKSYDDKLILVKILTEKEQSRVVLMVKNMLRSTNAEKKK